MWHRDSGERNAHDKHNRSRRKSNAFIDHLKTRIKRKRLTEINSFDMPYNRSNANRNNNSNDTTIGDSNEFEDQLSTASIHSKSSGFLSILSKKNCRVHDNESEPDESSILKHIKKLR